jgi:predicted phage-related endonuclease
MGPQLGCGGIHDWPADSLPAHVKIQVNQQMLCSGLEHAVVCIFDCARADWRLVVEEADRELQAFLLDYTARWWQRYVVEAHDPRCDDWAERHTLAKLRWPAPVDVVDVPMPDGALELFDELAKQRDIARAATKAAKEPEAQLREMLGSATAMVSPDGLAKIYRDGRNTLRRKELSQ